MGSFDVLLDGERAQLDAFVEEYRGAVEATLAGLTEEQARRRLVPSATTLLGLLKHVTWMQRVWFEECVGGSSRRELGLVRTPDESFRLTRDDTIASVTAAHRAACATARAAVEELALDDVVTGHRAGPRTLRWVYLQVLRELAHHCGHADILREQVLEAGGGERAALLHFLAAQREAALDVLDGLSDADARAVVVPSGWTPLGMTVHLGDVERHWFAFALGGDLQHTPALPGTPTTLAEAVAAYRAEIARSERLLDGFDLDEPPTEVPPELPGEIRTVRDVVLHVIEETARHAGHLDIARELLDGTVGRGPR